MNKLDLDAIDQHIDEQHALRARWTDSIEPRDGIVPRPLAPTRTMGEALMPPKSRRDMAPAELTGVARNTASPTGPSPAGPGERKPHADYVKRYAAALRAYGCTERFVAAHVGVARFTPTHELRRLVVEAEERAEERPCK